MPGYLFNTYLHYNFSESHQPFYSGRQEQNQEMRSANHHPCHPDCPSDTRYDESETGSSIVLPRLPTTPPRGGTSQPFIIKVGDIALNLGNVMPEQIVIPERTNRNQLNMQCSNHPQPVSQPCLTYYQNPPEGSTLNSSSATTPEGYLHQPPEGYLPYAPLHYGMLPSTSFVSNSVQLPVPNSTFLSVPTPGMNEPVAISPPLHNSGISPTSYSVPDSDMQTPAALTCQFMQSAAQPSHLNNQIWNPTVPLQLTSAIHPDVISYPSYQKFPSYYPLPVPQHMPNFGLVRPYDPRNHYQAGGPAYQANILNLPPPWQDGYVLSQCSYTLAQQLGGYYGYYTLSPGPTYAMITTTEQNSQP